MAGNPSPRCVLQWHRIVVYLGVALLNVPVAGIGWQDGNQTALEASTLCKPGFMTPWANFCAVPPC